MLRRSWDLGRPGGRRGHRRAPRGDGPLPRLRRGCTTTWPGCWRRRRGPPARRPRPSRTPDAPSSCDPDDPNFRQHPRRRPLPRRPVRRGDRRPGAEPGGRRGPVRRLRPVLPGHGAPAARGIAARPATPSTAPCVGSGIGCTSGRTPPASCRLPRRGAGRPRRRRCPTTSSPPRLRPGLTFREDFHVKMFDRGDGPGPARPGGRIGDGTGPPRQARAASRRPGEAVRRRLVRLAPGRPHGPHVRGVGRPLRRLRRRTGATSGPGSSAECSSTSLR